jgi:hypothetical protein
MPNPIIQKVSNNCGISVDKAEDLWEKAVEIARKQYNTKTNFAIITSIFKHSLGKECNNKLGWNTNWKHKSITESIDMLLRYHNEKSNSIK